MRPGEAGAQYPQCYSRVDDVIKWSDSAPCGSPAPGARPRCAAAAGRGRADSPKGLERRVHGEHEPRQPDLALRWPFPPPTMFETDRFTKGPVYSGADGSKSECAALCSDWGSFLGRKTRNQGKGKTSAGDTDPQYWGPPVGWLGDAASAWLRLRQTMFP